MRLDYTSQVDFDVPRRGFEGDPIPLPRVSSWTSGPGGAPLSRLSSICIPAAEA